MPTKNVIELAFLQKIPHYVLLFIIGKTRSYFVTSDDEKLDDLK